jgi:hypothetical protein
MKGYLKGISIGQVDQPSTNNRNHVGGKCISKNPLLHFRVGHLMWPVQTLLS